MVAIFKFKRFIS